MILIIKNGHVVDPDNNVDDIATLIIRDGIIESVVMDGKEVDESCADKIIDANGKYVLPGLIDLHVHLREPGFEYKETIKTGAMAAAAGGFTTICPMPNTNPVIDSPDMVKYIMDKAKDESKVNIVPVGAVTVGQRGNEPTSVIQMVKEGAGAISEDGKSVMNSAVYAKSMKMAKEAGIPVLAHCEDKNLVRAGALNEGEKSKELGVNGITNQVEDIIVARDILLAKETGAKLHLCHCSTADSVRMVKEAKEEGIRVTAEVCPHHFILCDEDIPGDDANYKMNPPLRSKADVNALLCGLRDNVMDVISTDHAPHSKEEKQKSIANAPFGIVGIETSFALSYTYLVKAGWLTMRQLVEKMSTNPAKVLGISKGTLGEGKVADITIVDLNDEYVIDPDKFLSKGKNTPFGRYKVNGSICYTIVNGNVVYSR